MADRPPTPQQQLDAAIDSALLLGGTDPEAQEPSVPLGRSWKLEEDGRLARSATGQPVPVEGVGALVSWMTTSLTVARGAHPSVDPAVGLDDPNGPLGRPDPQEAASDWAEEAREALLVHDRIEAVTDVEVLLDPDRGLVEVQLNVVLDDASLAGLAVAAPLSYLTGG